MKPLTPRLGVLTLCGFIDVKELLAETAVIQSYNCRLTLPESCGYLNGGIALFIEPDPRLVKVDSHRWVLLYEILAYVAIVHIVAGMYGLGADTYILHADDVVQVLKL